MVLKPNLGPSKRESIYVFVKDMVVTCTETESVVTSEPVPGC